MINNLSKFIAIAFKGLCMGAADIVPGVSGGTIALLMGVYNELIRSIKSIDGTALKLLFSGEMKALWQHINGAFLISILIGITISVFTLSRIMKYTLEIYPIELWSFFFGLIGASSIVFLRGIKQWNITNITLVIMGVAVAIYVCLATPGSTPESYLFIFISGMIAICAMILPGISGSFILLLLGKYEFIMTSIADINIPIILTFASGAVIGILIFSHILSLLLNKFYSQTISLLAGFMIGSLLKVWPWKEVYIAVDIPILPHKYVELTGDSAQLTQAIMCLLVGAAIVFFIPSNLKSKN